MKAEKLGLYSSLVLLTGFVIREIIKAKIKVRTMAIRRSALQAFFDDAGFKTLYFNPFYDNKFLAKDVVVLDAYQDKSGEAKEMTPVFLETAGEDLLFENEREYSVYKLDKDDLKTILGRTAGDEKIVYILFKPILYKEDNRYLAYQIGSADVEKTPIPELSPIFQAESVRAFAEGDPAPQGPQATSLLASTSLISGRLVMNPSPPARSNISVM